MIENRDNKPLAVIGPLGEPLTLNTVPSASTRRWVIPRKAEVVAAVDAGLRVTRMQHYHDLYERQMRY